MVKKYVFDCNSNYWSSDPWYNFLFLKSREQYYHDRITYYGFVPLFTVLEDLGFKPKESDLKYVLDESDGFIDFRISDQAPRSKGRPKKKFTIYLKVRPINEEEV